MVRFSSPAAGCRFASTASMSSAGTSVLALANQQAQQDPDNIILEIDPGSYKVNTKPLTREQLGPFLTQTYTGRPKKVIFVKADGQVTYQTVIEAMDIARGAGVKVIGQVLPPTT